MIRAVGDPVERFTEDKLRMLRAVRFSAAYEFSLEAKTLEAIRRMVSEITVVSPERISMEMQRILVDRNRAQGMRLLLDTGLAAVILPEVVPSDGKLDEPAWQALRHEIKQASRPATAPIIATDNDPAAVDAAQKNAKTAGVDHLIQFEVCDFAETAVPADGEGIEIG